jgi:hypothetical protein
MLDASKPMLRSLLSRVALASIVCWPWLAHGACALSAGAQGRQYADDAQSVRSYEFLGSVASEATCNARVENIELSAKVFGRLAQHDSQRTHVDVRELTWTADTGSVRFSAGINQVFWGVMEFSHLVDTLNQSDLLEDAFGEVKLGQPMAQIGLRESWGALDAFVLPYFRTREFPNWREPLRAAPPLPIGDARFESEQGREHWDWALRYTLTHGPLDVGISYFDGTSRDPDFTGPQMTPSGPAFLPYYPLIAQLGLDLQLTFGQWSFKFEGAHRDRTRASSDAYAVGIEYAFTGVAGTPIDLTLAAEYVQDERTPRAVPGFLEHDWAAGIRVALNDARSTEGKFGLIVDREHGSQAWALELGSRIADDWKLAAQARRFMDVSRQDPLWVIHGDSYVDVSLTRYF